MRIVGQPVLLVARVDALRAVAGEEVAVELQSRDALQDRYADLLRAARIDGGLVHHDVALLQHRAQALAGLHQRRQVRPLVVIDRRRHRDDVDAAGLQVLDIAGEGQPRRLPSAPCATSPACCRLPAASSLMRAALRSKPDGLEVLAELGRQRQAHVAQAHDTDAQVRCRLNAAGLRFIDHSPPSSHLRSPNRPAAARLGDRAQASSRVPASSSARGQDRPAAWPLGPLHRRRAGYLACHAPRAASSSASALCPPVIAR